MRPNPVDKNALILAAAAGGVLVVSQLTKSKRPPMTNTGAPVDYAGQVLPGMPDYIQIYVGQRAHAIKNFGALPEASTNNKIQPVTSRAYAGGTVLPYWRDEINRLCGLNYPVINAPAPTHPGHSLKPLVMFEEHPEIDISMRAGWYRGIVSFDSARAIVKGWNRYQAELRRAIINSGVQSSTAPMSAAATERFWEAIRGLAIVVDVDRAVPDHTGFFWKEAAENALRLPGQVGDLARRVAEEALSFVPDWMKFAALGIGAIAVWRLTR